MVPGFVLSSADGAHLSLMLLIYSCFDFSWPQTTSEDAQSLRAAWKFHKEPTAGCWCQDLFLV